MPTNPKRGRSASAPTVAKVTVAELRTNFKAVEAKLAKGVRVQVTRRGEVVAEMQAPGAERPFADRMPDFMVKLKEMWGPQPWNVDTTAMVSEGRERDFLS